MVAYSDTGYSVFMTAVAWSSEQDHGDLDCRTSLLALLSFSPVLRHGHHTRQLHLWRHFCTTALSAAKPLRHDLRALINLVPIAFLADLPNNPVLQSSHQPHEHRAHEVRKQAHVSRHSLAANI